LIFLAKHQDRTNPEFAEQLKKQEEEMHAYFAKPFEPQIIGAASLATGGKPMEPPKAYAENCAVCHGDNGEGTRIATGLIGVAGKPQRSKEDLLKILDDSRAYGMKAPMPENFPTMTQEDKQKVVEWMMQLK
jgi:ubiquinol-cytochrome c reductase cytochrome b subunit